MSESDQDIVNQILGIAPDDETIEYREVTSLIEGKVEGMTDGKAEGLGKKKKKKKKKDGVDLALEIIEKTIDLLLAATPRLLDAIASYLSIGGDPNVEIKGVPLVEVCKSHPEVVELLLKYGAMGR